MGQQAYQSLQLETEQPSNPSAVKRKIWTLGLGVLLGVLILVAAIFLALRTRPAHRLEVFPDSTPASKRGAGLLLTYAGRPLSVGRNAQCSFGNNRAQRCQFLSFASRLSC